VCRLTRQRAPRAEGAQFVTRHGEEVAVVLNIAEYRRMSGADVDLKDYLRSAPDLDALEIVRDANPAARSTWRISSEILACHQRPLGAA
jgi:hypothetical protein